MPTDQLKVIHQKKVLLGLATVYKLRDGRIRFKFSVGRILAVLSVAFIVTWVGVFTAAFVHFKYRRGYKEASYVETLLFPFTHKTFQKKRGDYYIESAYDSIENQDYKTALNLLRNGLLRSSDNLKARRTLSEFYEFLFNRPQLAFDLLADGIPFLKDKPEESQNEYIQYLFSVGSRNQLDDKLIEAGNVVLAEVGDQLSVSMNALVNYQIASGYRNKGQIDASKKLVDQNQLYRFSEGLVLQSQLLWDSGQEDLSIQLLQNKLDQYRENRPIYEKLIALLEEKQLFEKARQYAVLYQLEHPAVFQSHLARLQQYYKQSSADQESIDSFIKEYVSDFKTSPIAIRQLAILTSKFGDVTNTQKVLDAFPENDTAPAQLLSDFILIESMIRAEKFEEAITELVQIESSITEEQPLNPDSQSILLSLETAAFNGNGDQTKAQQALRELLKSPVIKIDRFLAVAYLFIEVDAPDIALEIMDHCLETQDYNANIREALIAIHLKSGDVKKLSNILTDAIEARRLPNRLLIESYRLLSSDRNIHVENREQVMGLIQGCFSTDYLFKVTEG